MVPTREEALALLSKYNDDESHIKHALAVEGAMRHFARKLGGDEDLWGVVGILHDIDWEKTMDEPSRHCHLAPELLRQAGVEENVIHAVQSHGYGICTDVEPANDMEKVLFTIDELTGLVITAGLVRPSRSLSDLEVKSVKKKWKDKAFARGVDREIIQKGAEMMGMPLEEVIENTILAMRPIEKEIGLG
jgi:putative nucleotidyltransferase with HDIG domain